jgi:hypothetical protein
LICYYALNLSNIKALDKNTPSTPVPLAKKLFPVDRYTKDAVPFPMEGVARNDTFPDSIS